MKLFSPQLVIASGLWERVLPTNKENIISHSSFASVKNFKFNNRMITLQGPSSPLIPFGIKFLNAKQFSYVSSNDFTFFISKSRLSNNKTYFDLNKSIKQDLKLISNREIQLAQLEKIREGFQNYNYLWQSKGNKYDFTLSFKHWINNSYNLNSSLSRDLSGYEPFYSLLTSHDKLKSFYSYLLGWGSGSTPAGDDFLIGFLAGIYLVQQHISDNFNFGFHLLQKLLSYNITVVISQEFLYYALKGEFSESILEFISQIVKNEVLSRDTIINILIGSSSGLDFICGFIWIIEQILGK